VLKYNVVPMGMFGVGFFLALVLECNEKLFIVFQDELFSRRRIASMITSVL